MVKQVIPGGRRALPTILTQAEKDAIAGVLDPRVTALEAFRDGDDFVVHDPASTVGVSSFVGSIAPPNAPTVAGTTKIQHLFGFPQLTQGTGRSARLKFNGFAIGGAFEVVATVYAGSTTYYPYTILDVGGNVSNAVVFWGDHDGTLVLYVRFETTGKPSWWRSFVENFRTGFAVTEFTYATSQVA